MKSGSVECTSRDFFLRLFRNYVYYHFIFPKINKGGLEKSRGLENCSKINKPGGGHYSVLASTVRSQKIGRRHVTNKILQKVIYNFEIYRSNICTGSINRYITKKLRPIILRGAKVSFHMM